MDKQQATATGFVAWVRDNGWLYTDGKWHQWRLGEEEVVTLGSTEELYALYMAQAGHFITPAQEQGCVRALCVLAGIVVSGFALVIYILFF